MNQIEYSTPGRRALSLIRREWQISFGAVILAVIFSLFVSPIWIPIVDLAIAMLLLYLGLRPNVTHGEPCGRLLKTVAFGIMVTALISFLINITYRTSLIHLFFEHSTLNESIPFITSLIIFPVISLLSIISGTRFFSDRHLADCHLRNEYNPDQPLFSSIIHSVYRKILNCMGLVTGAITVIDWTYYILFYRNVNLNSPDRFFFFFVPAAVFVGSIFYVRSKFGMVVLRTGKDAFRAASGIRHPHNSTILRYLVVKDNKLLLDVSPEHIQNMNVDTPVKITLPPASEPTLEEAKEKFKAYSHIPSVFIKLLYRSEQPQYNNYVYHYLVNIPEDEGIGDLSGDWTSLDWIDRYMKMGVAASELAIEIHRFYTISMAWKTYDYEGRRRYPIKNYRPSFRLDDAKDWDVDYEDNHWLKIARNNEDSRPRVLRLLFARRNKKEA